MSGIGGNEPAGYNYEAADALKAKADNLQGKLHGQQGSRSSAVWTAMREFRGHYSEIFDSNADLATDGRNLIAERLGELSTAVMELKAAAEAEDQRRADARAWEERRREENLLYGAAHEVRSFFGFGDDPNQILASWFRRSSATVPSALRPSPTVRLTNQPNTA